MYCNSHLGNYRNHDYSSVQPTSSIYPSVRSFLQRGEDSGHHDDYYQSHEKYFPKSMIGTLPGVSHVSYASYEDLSVSPYDKPSTADARYKGYTTSPFQSKIHLSDYHSVESNNSSFGAYSSKSHKFSDRVPKYMSENPFDQKYLVSSLNQNLKEQVECAKYCNYDFHGNQTKRKTHRNESYGRQTFNNTDQLQNYYSSSHDQKSEQSLGEGMRRLAEKYGNSVNGNRIPSKSQEHYNHQNGAYEVDEKEFDSFGKGKEGEQQAVGHTGDGSQRNYDQRQSIIHKVVSLAEDQKKQPGYRSYGQGSYGDRNDQSETQSRHAYINSDSDKDSHASGTFKIPDVIINELNTHQGERRLQKVESKGRVYGGSTDDYIRSQMDNRRKAVPESQGSDREEHRATFKKRYSKSGKSSRYSRDNAPYRLSVKGKQYELLEL